jgi:hypothetical protein
MTDVTQGVSAIDDIAAKLHPGVAGSASPSQDLGSLLGSMSMTVIVVSLVAGLVGTCYFMYGKKNSNFTMLFSGVALCVVPYFIGNTILLIIACAAMAAAPFVIERFA